MAKLKSKPQPKPQKPKKDVKFSIMSVIIVSLVILTAFSAFAGYVAVNAVTGSLPFSKPSAPAFNETGAPSGEDGPSEPSRADDEKTPDAELPDSLSKQTLTLRHNDETFSFTFGELGAAFSGKTLRADPAKLRAAIASTAEKVNFPAKAASMAKDGSEFIVSDGSAGTVIDEEKTAASAGEVVASGESGEADIIMKELPPPYSPADYEGARSLIGSCSTKISGGASGRNQNVQTAISKINNVNVYPGEVFSTNARFGDMTYANGYRPAPVIQGGKLVDDYGGGVCQVSSTLYIALINAELEIVERRNHSLKVAYADYGFDATLAGNYIDLKFKNNTSAPIMIEASMANGLVTVNIYGKETRSTGRQIKLSNRLVSKGDVPPEKEIPDDTLPLGSRATASAGRAACKYQLIKTVYEDGRKVDEAVVNTSSYSAQAPEVRVGTNAALTPAGGSTPEYNDYNAPDEPASPPDPSEVPPDMQGLGSSPSSGDPSAPPPDLAGILPR
ncbi:MAG: VanW family protein [Clostridiales bacterium]|jgi:vancomycin resistance protein YoaR|nr:VanW family protein [Clostridiales bacterium]